MPKVQIGVLGNMDVGKTSLQLKYADPNRELKMEKVKTVGVDTNSVFVRVFE